MRGSISARLAWLGSVCLFAVGSLVSCGGGGGDDSDSAGNNDDFAVTLTLRSLGGSERSTFAFGESIILELTVTNQSGSTRELTLPTNQIFDLAVLADGTQNARWRWSFNRTFAAQARSDTFAGHQSFNYPFVWNGVLEDGTQIMPGTYQVRGTLAYSGYASDWRSNNTLAAPLRTITITN
jgi:hypothetical protein